PTRRTASPTPRLSRRRRACTRRLQTRRSSSSAATAWSSARPAPVTASSARRRSASGSRTSRSTLPPDYSLAVPTYQVRGEVPRKRHIQFRDNGTLLTEEVMGLEGFSGNEAILY